MSHPVDVLPPFPPYTSSKVDQTQKKGVSQRETPHTKGKGVL